MTGAMKGFLSSMAWRPEIGFSTIAWDGGRPPGSREAPGDVMNYRHVYHAGNFADLLKHAVLTELLRRLTGPRPPLTVIDTHAGAGVYDLDGGQARRTGEGAAGVGRLMEARDAPAIFDDLRNAVEKANTSGAVRFYPGSPLVIASGLRPGDRYIGCELRADDFVLLRASMSRQAGATLLKDDGWTIAAERAPKPPASLLLLADPPYERGDDVEKATWLSRRVLKRNAQAVVALWVPIKDLTGFDAFVTALADATDPAPLMIAEVRLRPLSDPMMMNGCAMIVANPPAGLDRPVAQAADWIARTLGQAGGSSRVERVGAH
jgi:23S rRNA (adenine2030-N6)-methyltransferase